jgi:hypothetical protein
MFQPTNNYKKDNNLGLPPKPISLEELADKQELPMMGASPFILPALTLINKNPPNHEVPAPPMQVGAGTKLIVPNLPVLTADEVLAAPAQAGASTGLPVLTADMGYQLPCKWALVPNLF